MRIGATLRTLAQGLLVAAGVLLVAEMVLSRRFPAREEADQGVMVPDPDLGWSLRPGDYAPFHIPHPTHINQDGLRGPERSEKAAGELRLAALGDSTVFGVQVDDQEVFVQVAARALSRQLGHPVSPVNSGTPKFDSSQALHLYQSRLWKWDPDIVVIAAQWRDGDDDVHTDDSRSGGIDLGGLLSRTAIARALLATLAVEDSSNEVAGSLSPGEGRPRVAVGDYKDNLTTLIGAVERRGARPVLLILPSVFDLTRAPLPEPRTRYRQALRELAEEEHLLLVDGAAPFAGGAPDLMLDDVHPSASGHALLGEALAEAIAGAW